MVTKRVIFLPEVSSIVKIPTNSSIRSIEIGIRLIDFER